MDYQQVPRVPPNAFASWWPARQSTTSFHCANAILQNTMQNSIYDDSMGHNNDYGESWPILVAVTRQSYYS